MRLIKNFTLFNFSNLVPGLPLPGAFFARWKNMPMIFHSAKMLSCRAKEQLSFGQQLTIAAGWLSPRLHPASPAGGRQSP